MQLAIGLEHHHSAHAHEPVTGCHDNHTEVVSLKVYNEAVGDGKHGFTPVTECRTCEKVSDTEDTTNDNLNEGNHTKAPFSVHLPKFEMVKKETEFYTDKVVADIEAPKTIICFKEGSYHHIVKDICIDEGVYLFEKVSVENAAEDKRAYKFDGGDERSLPNEVPITDGLQSLNLKEEPLSSVDKEDAKQQSFRSFLDNSGGMSDKTNKDVCNMSNEKSSDNILLSKEFGEGQFLGHANNIGKEGAEQRSFRSFLEVSESKFDTSDAVLDKSDENTTEKFLPLKEFVMGDCQENVPNFNCEVGHSQSFNRDSNQSQSVDGTCNHPHSVNVKSNDQQLEQGAVEEANSTSSALSSALDEANQINSSNTTIDFTSDGKVESRIIAFDVDHPTTNAGSASKTPDFQTNQATRVTRFEEVSTDVSMASARSSFAHHDPADSNLSGPAFLSGPNTYSGQIPYSGSISLRSDSSATSARSFAFPVLQSEWNSSPVKMAKADRRHFRKHRSWRSGLLCCRF